MNETPKCGCGCNNYVSYCERYKRWNKYINHHWCDDPNRIVSKKKVPSKSRKMKICGINNIKKIKKNTINYHLGVLGANRYLNKIYIGKKYSKRENGKGYNTIKNRYEDWEIFWAAKKAYYENIRIYHPDRSKKDGDIVRSLNNSWEWIKERYDESGKKERSIKIYW